MAGCLAERAGGLLPDLVIAPDVALVGRRSGQPTAVVGAACLEMSQTLGNDRLMAAVRAVDATDSWSRLARQGLFHDLAGLRREATGRALGDGVARQATAEEGVGLAQRWLADRVVEVDRAVGSIVQATADPEAGLAGLSVAVGEPSIVPSPSTVGRTSSRRRRRPGVA